MNKEHLTPALMTKLAKTMDHMLNPSTKGETGFVLFVYPHEEGEIEALYVSNSQLEDVKKAVATWLSREEKIAQIGPPPQNEAAAVQQRALGEIKDEITRKYQGKRLRDKEHNEEFDYREGRDWQALYHYPDRFEIVSQAAEGQKANLCDSCTIYHEEHKCLYGHKTLDVVTDCTDYKNNAGDGSKG